MVPCVYQMLTSIQGEINLGKRRVGSPNVAHSHAGTSIMACAFPGGVVLGADSRTTSGSYMYAHL
jgi:20S proteasome alpha/beta subunit